MPTELTHKDQEYRILLSHKLLTPLATILANLSLLHRPECLDSPQIREEIVSDAEAAARKLIRAIDYLSALASVSHRPFAAEPAGQQCRPDDVSPGSPAGTPRAQATEILEMLAASVRARYPDLDARIEINLAAGPLTIPLAPEELEMVVEPLLDNALRFCDKPQASVRVQASTSGSSMILVVADNGRGIDPADHDRVFEHFVQSGDRSPRCAGVGLGLSLVKAIVSSHRGRVSLLSTPGVGTTIRIKLPT